MKNILIILILFCLQTNAQKKPFSRQKQSAEWVTNLKTIESKAGKIELIKAKIYSDTLYENHKKQIMLDGPRGAGKICKTVFIIRFKNKHYTLDLLENPKLNEIMEFINDENINQVEIMEDPMTSVAYYGDDGLCGVVTLYCNKKFERKLRNVL
ncbi:MAG: hypothetical protein RLY43_314 [Bacteroidota bacterium]|jgi:hypothetical protein